AGEGFMHKYHPLCSLATRDVVSRAIYLEMAKEGRDHVFLDLRHLDQQKLKANFPTILNIILKEYSNFDFTKDLIPVTPAAHYFCGGIATDTWARTSIPGLWAIGEVASTGLHGANRLASNSLLEALVFAKRAAFKLDLSFSSTAQQASHQDQFHYPDSPKTIEKLRNLMFDKVGIYRSREGLKQALQIINTFISEGQVSTEPRNQDIILNNMLCVAKAVVEDSLAQKDNKGAFFLSDLDECPNL
ncbi:MAG: FAD-binding protein, partial [Croceimicrobium sp.]